MSKRNLSMIVVVVTVVILVVLLFVTRERIEPGPPDMGAVLAVIDDVVFDLDAIDQQMERYPHHTRMLRQIDPDLFVQQVVDRHLLVREAERRGLDADAFYDELYEETSNPLESRDQAMIQALVEHEMQKLPPLTESYMRERFAANPDDFPNMRNFERHKELIEGIIRHEREVLRILAFMEELRAQSDIQINYRARDVLLDDRTPLQ